MADPSWLPVTKRFSSGEKATDQTHQSCPLNSRDVPAAISQRRAALSYEPESRFDPSREYARLRTASPWPARPRTSLPVAASQIETKLGLELVPAAMWLPSGEKAKAKTYVAPVGKAAICWPESASRMRTSPPQPPAAMRLPSGETATALIGCSQSYDFKSREQRNRNRPHSQLRSGAGH